MAATEEQTVAAEDMSLMSHVSATIPWQEGTEEDFKELREGLERLKQSGMKNTMNGDSSSEADTDNEDIPSYRRYAVDDEEEDDTSDDDDDVDPGDENPGLRLLWAAQHNHLDIATKLLDMEPSLINFRDEDEYSSLHRAAYSHHVEMLSFLLERGADPLALTEGGWTPLHSAARWNSYKCVEILLRHVPVNQVTAGGQTALHLACQSHNKETLELLLTHPDIDPSIVNSQGDTPRMVAERMGTLAPLFDAVSPSGTLSHREIS